MALESVSAADGLPKFPLALLEYRAIHDATDIWARISKSQDNYLNGFRDITFSMLQNAVDGACEWLKANVKPECTKGAIVYHGSWDPRYMFYLLGASKAGYKIVFPSPNYSLDTLNKILLEDLECSIVITDEEPTGTTAEFINTNRLCHVICPPVEYFLDQKHEHQPYGKSYEEAADEVLVILHTSGSTRDPKPIYWTNRWAASYTRQNLLKPPEGYESNDALYHGKTLISMMPVLHCGSFFSHIFSSIAAKSPVYYPLAKSSLHPQTLVDLIDHVHADLVSMPSSFVDYFGKNPDLVDKIAQKVEYIAFAGGPITEAAGELLSKKVKLFPLFGSTENGLWPTVRPKGDWDHTRWRNIMVHPNSSIRFDEIGDGRCEGVVERLAGVSQLDTRTAPALQAFPYLREWSSGDVFERNPSEFNSWWFSSRVEDVIHFADGTLFNPLPYEQHIRSKPEIAAALLFGLEKPNAALLIEPSASPDESSLNGAELIEQVWSYVEQANRLVNGDCHVEREHVVITQPERTLPRAYKGTVQRGRARKLYEVELQRVQVVMTA